MKAKLKLATGWDSVRRFVRSILREKRVDISIPFRGWTYYIGVFLAGSAPQGKRPSIWRVHPKCQDINGWRFGWRNVGAVWGREKSIYSANDSAHTQKGRERGPDNTQD